MDFGRQWLSISTAPWRWGLALLVLSGWGLGLLLGGLVSVLPVQAAVLLSALGVLLAVLVAPWPVLLWAFLVVLGFIVGPLQYVGGLSKAFWLPYLMGVLMGARAVGDSLSMRGLRPIAVLALPKPGGSGTLHRAALASDQRLMRWALGCLGVFFVTLLLSSVASRSGVLQAVVTGKEYLYLWSLPAAFLFGMLRMEHVRSIWPLMATWLFVQALVVVWQRFVVAPRRGGDAPWDAVVGLFAGNAQGAGGSGTMAMVSLWAAAGVIMGWRAGIVHSVWALVAGASALLACALAEVKVAVLLLPLLGVVAIISPSPGEMKASPAMADRSRRWLRAVPWTVVILGLSGLLMWAHQQQFTLAASRESQSPAQYLQTTLSRNLDTRSWADEHGQLTRLGAIQYWWERQSVSDVPGWLVGHGVGAVRRSALAPSPLLQGLRFEPGRSAAVILLWETGVLGLAAWVGASVGLLVLALRLLRREPSARESVFLRAAAAAILITLLSLPYGADWFEAPHLAVMHLLGVSWVCAVYRRDRLRIQDAHGSGIEPRHQP